jgi:hypothetical protein
MVIRPAPILGQPSESYLHKVRNTMRRKLHISASRGQAGADLGSGLTRQYDRPLRRWQIRSGHRRHAAVPIQKNPAQAIPPTTPDLASTCVTERVPKRLSFRDPDHRNAKRESEAVCICHDATEGGEPPGRHHNDNHVELGRCDAGGRERGVHGVRQCDLLAPLNPSAMLSQNSSGLNDPGGAVCSNPMQDEHLRVFRNRRMAGKVRRSATR